jgi:DNA-binding beta-propeller fold protein YncE
MEERLVSAVGRRLALIATALALGASAQAAELKQVATIPVPGEKLMNWDIGFIDAASGRYFLADQSNRSIDVFDTATAKFIGRVDGFIGRTIENGKPSRIKSGPAGVAASGETAWAGDGDSTLKTMDLKTMTIADTTATGGRNRLDEMAFDPKDQVLIAVNDAEEPPFATLFSAGRPPRILARIPFPTATAGAEQPAYNPADGLFYVAIPEVDKQPDKGGVAVIDPVKGLLVDMLPNEKCRPNGLAFGPDENFVLGCTAKDQDGMPPVILVVNARTRSTVARIPDIGGADMVAYSARSNQYYIGAAGMPGGGVLGVIDAAANKLVETIPLSGGGTPHSVAVDDKTGRVFVPSSAEGGCGCVLVFGLQ